MERQDGKWSPQFGDYDKEVVEQERRDWIDAGTAWARHLLVIYSLDNQDSINAAVARLNERDAR